MSSVSPLYQSIQGDHIRLLELRGTCLVDTGISGLQDLAIECRLHTVSMAEVRSEQVSYQALSYTWGYIDAGRSIVCNGHRRQVTRNLFDALWEFLNAPKIKPSNLWVDAVCINQDNLAEKTLQVGMMSEIYERAELVVVWLGARASFATDTKACWKYARESKLEACTPDKRIEPRRESLYDSNPKELITQIVKNSLWARRIWTFQEVALASRYRFHYGPYVTVSFDRTSDIWGLQLLRDKRLAKTTGLPAVKKCELSHLLSLTCSRVCKNPLDKIYALLGMYKRPSRLLPDYSQSPQEVCAQVTLILAEELGCLYLGNNKNIDRSRIDQGHLPFVVQAGSERTGASWIHDWTKVVPELVFQKSLHTHEYPSLHSSFVRSVSVNGTLLTARGIMLGYWMRKEEDAEKQNPSTGRFARFPDCVSTAAGDASMDAKSHGSSEVGLEPNYLSTATITELWQNHQRYQCNCESKGRRNKSVDALSQGQSVYMCIVFGCPDVLIVRESKPDEFALLGFLGSGMAWSRALKEVRRVSWESVVKGKLVRNAVPRNVGVSVLPIDSAVLEPLQKQTSSSFSHINVETDLRSALDDAQLNWIPTYFNFDGQHPQIPCDDWTAPGLRHFSRGEIQAYSTPRRYAGKPELDDVLGDIPTGHILFSAPVRTATFRGL